MNKQRVTVGIACAVGVVVVAAVSAVFRGSDGPDSGTTIPTPAPADRDSIVAELVRAADAQHICYGWRLSGDDGTVVSLGSNLGADVAVDSDPVRCPRWVELRATVVWTAESSELDDRATRELAGSADLAGALPDQAVLDRVGATEEAFIDDPTQAVFLGVLAVPLLVAERGIALPVPAARTAASSDPAALAGPGSDFWRDRGVSVAIAIGLLVAAAGLLWVGRWATRQARIAECRGTGQAATVKARAAAGRKARRDRESTGQPVRHEGSTNRRRKDR